MKYKLTISYDGSGFSGFQYQKKERTIQGELENTISSMLGNNIRIQASGRTDSGVHAKGQVISFESETEIEADKLKYALNRMLPDDISVSDVEIVNREFHPRYSATSKEYHYICSYEDNVFNRRYITLIEDKLDINLMLEEAKALLGEHDFYSFSNRRKLEGSTVREIYDIDIIEEKEKIIFIFKGSGFLYKMIRIIVAYLIRVGSGKCKPGKTQEILLSRSREHTKHVAPPNGLYLFKVNY